MRKLVNTNNYIDRIFSLIDCGEFFRLNMTSQYRSINTDVNTLSVYIVKKK
jgi:hypothetical protein